MSTSSVSLPDSPLLVQTTSPGSMLDSSSSAVWIATAPFRAVGEIGPVV